jgi:hypothetical protein
VQSDEGRQWASGRVGWEDENDNEKGEGYVFNKVIDLPSRPIVCIVIPHPIYLYLLFFSSIWYSM